MSIALHARNAHADAIIVTKAMTASTVVEIYVEDSVVRVEMEIGAPDLLAFQNLLPDEIRARMGLEPKPYPERLTSFTEEDLVIRADGGPPLPARPIHIEARRRVLRDELTREPLLAAEDTGEPVIYVVLEYPFSDQPKTLTFQPPTAGGAFPAATIGFITYHRGLPVMDFRCLDDVATLDLNWDDPWFSSFRNRSLWFQDDSPTNAFLYVAPPPSRWRRGLTGLSWCAVLIVGVVLVGEVRKASRGQGTWLRVVAPALLLMVAAGGAYSATRSSLVTNQQAEEIVSAVVHNVYRAFDFKEEDLVYASLEQSVTGELVNQTFVEIRRSLELPSRGGVRARAAHIDVLEVAVRRSQGRSFSARCTWTVAGSVGHSNNTHQSTIRYEAQLTIAPVDGRWKITGLEPVAAVRP